MALLVVAAVEESLRRFSSEQGEPRISDNRNASDSETNLGAGHSPVPL